MPAAGKETASALERPKTVSRSYSDDRYETGGLKKDLLLDAWTRNIHGTHVIAERRQGTLYTAPCRYVQLYSLVRGRFQRTGPPLAVIIPPPPPKDPQTLQTDI